MQPELRYIEPNDFDDWEAFVAYTSTDPHDDYGWFTVEIGTADEVGGDLFQVLVVTPRSKQRTRRNGQRFRGLMVESYEAKSVELAISQFIGSVSGSDWPDCVRKLQAAMHWEYE